MKAKAKHRSWSLRGAIFLTLAALVLLPPVANGQSSTTTAREPGTPAGSYHLGDADTVNLFTGNLNYHLPLLKVRGRGEARTELGVVIEGQWDWRTEDIGNGFERHVYSFMQPHPLAFVGRVDYGVTSEIIGTCESGGSAGSTYLLYRGAMTYIESDGTQHALRDRVLHGLPRDLCAGAGFDIGNVFESTDGSFITFVTDATMHLACTLNSDCTTHVTGYLFLPDGSKSRVVDSQVMWTQDRNGNRIDYAYENNSYKRLKTVTDSAGRTVNIDYNVSEPAPYGNCTKITYKGFGGQDHVIRVSLEEFNTGLLRDTQPGDTPPANLFYDDPNDNVFMTVGGQVPIFVRAVWLPNGRSYQFKYNSLSQLARIDLPTGGAIEYDYADILRLPFESPPNTGVDPKITNQVSVKRAYNSDNVLISKTVFSNPTSYTQGVIPGSRGGTVRDVDVLDPAGNRLAKSRRYFYGAPDVQFGMEVPWWHGKEFRTELFGTNGTTLLQVGESDWRQRPPSWCATTWPCNADPAEQAPTNNPFLVETRTTLADDNLVSKVSSVNPANQSWAVDAYNNRTDVWTYDYGVGQAGGLVRHTHNSYINNVSSPGNVFLFSLNNAMSEYSVGTAGQETLTASTQTVYDEYAQYPLLTYGTVPNWQDPGSLRGNPTTVKMWLDTASAWVETPAQYDQLGNVRHSWDALGNMSEVLYDDSFCNGTTCGPSGYVPNTFAFPTLPKTPKSDPSGTYGSAAELTSSTVYDYYTGLTYSSTDANGQTTRVEYEDQPGQLDRPKAVVRPDGGRTDFYYNDTVGDLYVRVVSDLDQGRRTESRRYFDGMGRVYREATYEN